MKIAICGSHGVGKTTISRLIAEKYDLPILPDIVVDAHHAGFTINEGSDITTQIWLTSKQMENERKHDTFVADKCIFDYHVYSDSLGMHDAIVQTTLQVAMSTHNYDYIFYIKPEFDIENDGLRSVNKDFQYKVDQCYHLFLTKNEFPYLQITGSIEERLQQVVNHIEQSRNQ